MTEETSRLAIRRMLDEADPFDPFDEDVAETDLEEPILIAGLPVARKRTDQVLDTVFSSLDEGRGGWIVTANLDFVQRASQDADARALYARADLIVADGAPLVWAARLMGSPLPERVAGSDLVWSLAERAAREGRSLYLLGGDGEDATTAADVLRRRFPGLHVAGVANPWLSLPPSATELNALRQDILEAQPDLLYAGFGSPKQELVIEALRHDLPRVWMMGCGISLSFIAGTRPRAPRWMQTTGIEWIYRMWNEPRRLGPRYLRNLPFAIQLLWRARFSRP